MKEEYHKFIEHNLSNDALTLIDTYKRILKKDIWVAINGNSRYLAALGLSTYTEVFGGLSIL